MNRMEKLVFGCLVSVVASVSACTAEHSTEEDAPIVASETLGAADEGASYNGWTQSVYLRDEWCDGDPAYMAHSLTRTSGDDTRGGGACYVIANNTGCATDATCLTVAQSQYGSSAYGYCYQGSCYSRPGSQATYCVVNPNRGPGGVDKWLVGTTAMYPSSFVIGCMTKSAGPNTACGGTDTSQYMRTRGDLTQYGPCYPW
jgi:hypothetical protein